MHRLLLNVGRAMYEHLHVVSPGNGVSAQQLRLIWCFSKPGWKLPGMLEVACTGAGRKVAQR